MEIKAGDILFLDTNILLTATDTSRLHHKIALDIFNKSLQTGFHICISVQITREYLVVAIRALEANGLGLKLNDALSNIEKFKTRTVFLEETEFVNDSLLEVVRSKVITGVHIHDANVLATLIHPHPNHL